MIAVGVAAPGSGVHAFSVRRLRYFWIVLVAVTRAILASRRGRLALAVVVVVAAAWHFASGGQATPITSQGAWKGFANMYAPGSGTLTIDRERANVMSCTLRGQAGVASGDGWVFKGSMVAQETSCTGQVAPDGRVTGILEVGLTWRGRVKGIGGDWDDESGSATCKGELRGTLAGGGDWPARCTRGDKEWTTRLTWSMVGEIAPGAGAP